MQPLSGLLVLDFTTLLPGPLASLMLAEAGAEVIKIERPGGEDMRRFPPIVDGESAAFAMLNRGKKSLDARSQERCRPRQAHPADPARRHPDGAIPPRRDGAARSRLRGRARTQPAADLLLDQRLRPERAARRRGRARHQLYRQYRAARFAAGAARSARGAADAGGRHRRRQFSGGDQYSAGVARARPKRAGLSSRHRHDRRHVHLRLVCAGARARRPENFPSRASCGWSAARRAISSIRPRTASSSPAARSSRNSGRRSPRRSDWRRNSSTTRAIRRRRATRWPN